VDGAQVVGMLIGFVIGMTIVVLIGAVILRAAISLYNRMASASQVPEPTFGKALLITLVTMLVNFVVSLVLNMVVGGAGAAANANEQAVGGMAQLLSLPVSLCVLAFMLSTMLPTTFGRGFLVSLCNLLIWIVVAVFIVLLIFGLGMLARG